MTRSRAELAPVAAVIAISGAVAGAYFANRPHLDIFPDTPVYAAVADHLPSSFISAGRLPGYPVLMAISSWLPGGRDVALVVLQCLMFVAAVVFIYLIARVALGHAWVAFVVAFLIATDLLMAGFARIAMSETIAVFLTTGVALAAVAYLRSAQLKHLWLTAALMAALLLTRPEYAFLGIVLLPYLLVVMWRRGQLDRRLLAQGAASVAMVVLVVVGYSAANWIVNGYLGISNIGNVALLGKVMVYRMEGEAPPPYDRYTALVSAIGPAAGPWPLMQIAPFNDPNHQLAGDFARAVVEKDPVGFANHTFGTILTSSTDYDAVYLRINDQGAFAPELHKLLALDERRYAAFVLVPALALVWLVFGLVARPENHRAQVMGAMSVIVIYGTLTAAAGTFDEFGRIHMPINGLSTLLVVGSLFFNLELAYKLRNLTALIPLWVAAIKIAYIALIPIVHSTRITAVALAAIAVLQALVLVGWSTRPTAAQVPAPAS
ncbi:MAG: glycosyltransferase family 39 protein [Chloroflexi bacterium]|nr:MAG: glycosyltransferase family 39 protein [Chloroflexota bacterium]